MNRQEIINRIGDYLDGRISAKDLSEWYFPMFKAEPLGTPEVEYRIYSSLFLDLDEYVPWELWDPQAKYCIDEDELRKRLGQHVVNLKKLGQGRSGNDVSDI